MRKEPLYVSIVVDTEEEGLFSGRFPRKVTVDNVAQLACLAPLTEECGIPMTLVCAHPVFTDATSRRVLDLMRTKYGAEIGAHLHYWSTPPYNKEELSSDVMLSYTEAKHLPQEELNQKFQALFSVAKDFCGHPVTTFRMGRWDMARELWPLLAQNGITVDSSIRPWQYPHGWRDFFYAPTQPYSVEVGDKVIIEIPDTSVPLLPITPGVTKALYNAPPFLKHSWHKSVVMLPSFVHHNLAYMKAAALVMLARGDRVLNLTCHSTEIVGGATPHVPNQAAADKVLARAKEFLLWLAKRVPVRGITLGQLAKEKDLHIPKLTKDQYALPGDWHP